MRYVEVFDDPVAEYAGVGYVVRSFGRRTATWILYVLFTILGLIPWVLKLLLVILPILMIAYCALAWVWCDRLAQFTGEVHWMVQHDEFTMAMLSSSKPSPARPLRRTLKSERRG